MKSDKDKRVVLITGCGSSLGKELISAYAKSKDTIVVGLTRSNKFYEIKNRTEGAFVKPNVHIFGVDYSSFENISSRVLEIIIRFKKIDVLVNNTGMSVKARFDSILNSEMHKAMQANFCVPLCVCKSVLPYMLSRDKGKIINILPSNRLTKDYESGVFSKDKILDSFSSSLRRELTKTRIKVKAMKPCSLFKNKLDQVKWANSLAQAEDDVELYKDKVLGFIKKAFQPEQQITSRDKLQD